jgi:hypothetical protein
LRRVPAPERQFFLYLDDVRVGGDRLLGSEGVPIGAHQGLAHPLAEAKIEVELARLMTQKAAWATDAGTPGAGEAANMAKYAAAEAAMLAVDVAIQVHGGTASPPRTASPASDRRPLVDSLGPAHRPGQPRDDPQLRRRALPAPAQVVLAAGERRRHS